MVSLIIQGKKKKFTWANIVQKYKARETQWEDFNIYKYCVYAWRDDGKKIIPQFFGFNDHPTWPLEESYSKWNLVLFKPWREQIETLKGRHTTYADALWDYIYEENFPASKRFQILRAKRKEKPLDLASENYFGGEQRNTPTDDAGNTNNYLQEAADAATSPIADDNEYEDMGDTMFRNLPTNIPEGYDWSKDFDHSLTVKLVNYAKEYYQWQQQQVLEHEEEDIKLFEYDTYKPENCHGDDQTFLVYEHLYYQRQWKLYQKGEIVERPPSLFTLVEGKPGTGKTFVTKTLRNVTRLLWGSNSADMASAPTGCAAALIDGKTHCRSCSIPTGRKFYQPPTNLKTSDPTRLRAMRVAMCLVISWFMDEHSLVGRLFWAWLKHRSEELRRPIEILDDNNETVQVQNSSLDPQIYNRPWGGIYFLYSMGDNHQLPPVLQKPMYSNDDGKQGTADFAGRIVLHNYIKPHNSAEVKSTIVVMNNVK